MIVLGDLNDQLDDSTAHNVFNCFINDPDNYDFVDMEIAQGSQEYWSYPSWPSHLDHVLITNELYDIFSKPESIIKTLPIDNYFSSEKNNYYDFISDHLPVGLKLKLDP